MGSPLACLSWHRRITGQGQAQVHWRNSQANVGNLCDTAEPKGTACRQFVNTPHVVRMLTQPANSLLALRSILCLPTVLLCIIENYISHTPLLTGFWVVKLMEMLWQRKSEAQIILPLLICLGWNFQQWLSPLSPSFRKIASHFVVPPLTGSSTEVLALAHQFQYRVLTKTPSPVVQPSPWMGQPPAVANYKVSLPSHVWLLSSFIFCVTNSSH